MTENLEEEYISGVIQTLQLSGVNSQQLPETICTRCPSSMWWVDKQGPKCFCRQTHLMTWTASEKPTLLGCDGYELAMAQHRARIARQNRFADQIQETDDGAHQLYGDEAMD